MESDRVTFFSPNNIITISKQQTLSDSYSQEGMLFSEGKSTEVLVRTADCRNDFLAIQAASVEGQTDRQTDGHTLSSLSATLSSPFSRRAWSCLSSSRSFRRRVSAFNTACTAGVSSATTSNRNTSTWQSQWMITVWTETRWRAHSYPVHTAEHQCWGEY